MSKPIFKKLTSWIVTAVFVVLVVGFSFFNQPNALAQSETLPAPTESTPVPVVSSAPATPPTTWFVDPVAANVRRLLTTNECVGCNLIEAQLERINLLGANLEGANLLKAELEKSNLQGTNLQKANLQGVDLSRANLSGVNLSGANLYDADLEGANLQGANLSGANLQKADLQKTNLTTANVEGANLLGADLEDAFLPPGIATQYQYQYQ